MNRIAVVTGANRGIGREVARQLADVGDTIYLPTTSPLPFPSSLHSSRDGKRQRLQPVIRWEVQIGNRAASRPDR